MDSLTESSSGSTSETYQQHNLEELAQALSPVNQTNQEMQPTKDPPTSSTLLGVRVAGTYPYLTSVIPKLSKEPRVRRVVPTRKDQLPFSDPLREAAALRGFELQAQRVPHLKFRFPSTQMIPTHPKLEALSTENPPCGSVRFSSLSL